MPIVADHEVRRYAQLEACGRAKRQERRHSLDVADAPERPSRLLQGKGVSDGGIGKYLGIRLRYHHRKIEFFLGLRQHFKPFGVNPNPNLGQGRSLRWSQSFKISSKEGFAPDELLEWQVTQRVKLVKGPGSAIECGRSLFQLGIAKRKLAGRGSARGLLR